MCPENMCPEIIRPGEYPPPETIRPENMRPGEYVPPEIIRQQRLFAPKHNKNTFIHKIQHLLQLLKTSTKLNYE